MKSKLGTLYIVISAVLWGILGIFVRLFNSVGLMAMQIVALRSLGAVALLAIYLLCTNRQALHIRLKDIWVFLGTGICSMVFFNFCYFGSMQHTSLAIAASLLYTAPVFVAFLARIFLKEKISRLHYIAIGVALCGCALESGFLTSTVSVDLIGFLMGLGAGLGYALYSIFGKLAIRRGYSDVSITFYTFLVALIATFGVLPTKQQELAIAVHQPLMWFAFLGLSFFSTILAYLFYTKGLMHVSAGYASVIACVEPVVATLVSFFIFHENITLDVFAGIMLILVSAILASYSE